MNAPLTDALAAPSIARVLLQAACAGALVLLPTGCGGGESPAEGGGETAEAQLVVEWHDEAQTAKKAEGRMAGGQREGEWTWWYDNGQVAVRGSFEGGKESGSWLEYHPNGQKKSEVTWLEGLRDGELVQWHENGREAARGRLERGVAVGQHASWYPDGKPEKEQTFVAGKLEGPQISYHPTGQKRTEGSCKGGVQVGEWVSYHPDGVLAMRGSYDDAGQPTGSWEYKHPNGADLMVVPHEGGRPSGVVVRMHADGTLESRLNYVDGQLDGPHEVTYPGGQLRSRGAYAGGARVGVWEYYNQDGSLNPNLSGTYEANSRVKDTQGNPVAPGAPAGN